ncbi:MAG: M13 family metallopeptidase [Chthoniobacterales bacterium]|nr:M13 family metallopeptidase [Chthoniobacterales bacterium]
MSKFTPLLVISVFCAFTLHAQTEPQKSKPLGSATPPAEVKKPSDPPTADNVPPPTDATDAKSDAETTGKPQVDKNPPAFDLKNMETSVKPSEDFYTYANGTWLKKNPIPPEESRWGSFNELIEKNNDALRIVAEKAAETKADPKLAPEVQKVGDYYASGMDEKSIEATKAKPLADEFKRIDEIKDRDGLLKEIAHLHTMGVTALFGFTSGQDDKNSTMVIAQAYQGGLGLPDRDYYTKEDDESKKLRDDYVAHVTKMLILVGEPQKKAADGAQKVLALETSLARPARTRVELRDPQKNYNKMSGSELQALMPDFKWSDYFKAIDVAEPGDVNVGQPDFFKAANDVFKTASLDDWKTYLRWQLIRGTAAELSTDFVNENFAFFGTRLTGAKQLKPRWKRVVTSTDGALGEALGKLYVADNFPPESKARMTELVKNIQEAMSDSIKSRDWMDDQTKQEALKKLASFTVKIGYPDKWRDYSTLKIDRGPFVLNAARAAMFETDRQLEKIGEPVDRSEWGMTPPTVNAYYNPNLNEIVFPAGILQPPFFNANADDAINYGGIGAVIAHEISHGFDDQGRQYDAVGNLRDWWTPESAAKYKERADRIVKQYSEYEPLPGMHINGELTQGENIADDGGVKLAFAALKKAQAGKPQEKIDGFTPEQRFFLGWAQVWRANMRDEAMKLRLVTDPHSPGKYRCNGPLSNTPEFKQAFNLPDDSPMVRPADQIVSIW